MLVSFGKMCKSGKGPGSCWLRLASSWKSTRPKRLKKQLKLTRRLFGLTADMFNSFGWTCLGVPIGSYTLDCISKILRVCLRCPIHILTVCPATLLQRPHGLISCSISHHTKPSPPTHLALQTNPRTTKEEMIIPAIMMCIESESAKQLQ